MKKIKRFIFAILFIFLCRSLFACDFVFNEQLVSNPSVLLSDTQNWQPVKFMVFCPDAVTIADQWGRPIPRPCQKIGSYVMECNVTLAGKIMNSVIFCQQVENSGGQPIYTPFYMLPCQVTREIKPAPKNYGVPVKLEPDGFIPQTMVHTPLGSRPIGDLASGDRVFCYDFDKAKRTEALVIDRQEKACTQDSLVEIKVENEIIVGALEQKFYLPATKKWVFAKDLKSGDLLLKPLPSNSSDFLLVKVDQVAIKQMWGEKTVTLTLANHQNFCVAQGLLVHNCSYVLKDGVTVPIFCDQAGVITGQSFEIGEFQAKQACTNSTFVGGEIIEWKASRTHYQSIVQPISPKLFPQEFQREVEHKYRLDITQTHAIKPHYKEERQRLREENSAALAATLANNLAQMEARTDWKSQQIEAQRVWQECAKSLETLKKQRDLCDQQARAKLINDTLERYGNLVSKAEQSSKECARRARLWQELINELQAREALRVDVLCTDLDFQGLDPEDALMDLQNYLKQNVLKSGIVKDLPRRLIVEFDRNFKTMELYKKAMPLLQSGCEQELFFSILVLTLATVLGITALHGAKVFLATCTTLIFSSLLAHNLIQWNCLLKANQPVMFEICNWYEPAGQDLAKLLNTLCKAIPRQPELSNLLNCFFNTLKNLQTNGSFIAFNKYVFPLILLAAVVSLVVGTLQSGDLPALVVPSTPLLQCLYQSIKELFQALEQFLKDPWQLLRTAQGPEPKDVLQFKLQINPVEKTTSREQAYSKPKVDQKAKAAEAKRIEKEEKQEAWRASQSNIKRYSLEEYREARNNGEVAKALPEEGAIIDDVEYGKHALEQMSPDNPNLRAEIERRWGEKAVEVGHVPGSENYRKYIKDRVVLRNIDPSEVKEVIENTSPKQVPSKYGGLNNTYCGEKITITTDPNGKVVTAWHKGDQRSW